MKRHRYPLEETGRRSARLAEFKSEHLDEVNLIHLSRTKLAWNPKKQYH